MGQLLLEGSGGMCGRHKTSGRHLLLPGCPDQLNEVFFLGFVLGFVVVVVVLMPSMLIACTMPGFIE